METSSSIANRLREVLIDGRWIANTNYRDLLYDLTLEEATKTLGNHNSIALLIYHVNYYLAGLLEAFATNTLEIRDKYSFDIPAMESAADWEALKNDFNNNAASFVAVIKTFDEEKLEAPFVDEQYGNYRRNLEGVIEHSYYHMGQISLIKKLIRSGGSV